MSWAGAPWADLPWADEPAAGGGGTPTIGPSGIASAEAFGTHAITRRAGVNCTGIASAEAFGVATVSRNGAAPATLRQARINLRMGLSL